MDQPSVAHGRHATNLELFLDLVFVFCVTQISGMITAEQTAGAVGRGLLLAWLVWWLWSQFTWIGTSIDIEQNNESELMVLGAVPFILLLAVALPQAFGRDAMLFASILAAVQLWSLVLQGRIMRDDPLTRRAFWQYAPIALVPAGLVVIGATAAGDARVGWWLGAAALDVVAALRGASGSDDGTVEWRIDAVHFTERHSLFVIIALGEVLVSIGANAARVRLDWAAAVAVIVAAMTSSALWWTYFAYLPKAAERVLTQAATGRRGAVARDLFTFGHFPIVAGIILFAVAIRQAVALPAEQLDGFHRACLAAGLALIIATLVATRWIAVRQSSPERMLALAALLLGIAVLGRVISATALVGLVGLVIVAMQTMTLRLLKRAPGSSVKAALAPTQRDPRR